MTEPTRFWEVEPETWRMVIVTNVNGGGLDEMANRPGRQGGGRRGNRTSGLAMKTCISQTVSLVG